MLSEDELSDRETAERQSVRSVAEMIAKFRTPPGMQWTSLADDIETAIKAREAGARADERAKVFEECAKECDEWARATSVIRDTRRREAQHEAYYNAAAGLRALSTPEAKET